MDFGDMLIVGAVGGAVVGVALIVFPALQKQKIKESIRSSSDFSPSYQYISESGATGIAIQESSKKICLLKFDRGELRKHIYYYRDIISVELSEDGHTVTKVSRSSQAATALVGGLMFGGVGAAVGALTGSSKTKGKIRSVELRVTVADTANPMFILNFQNIEAAAGGIIHRAATEKAAEWMGRLNAIIRQADQEEAQRAAPPPEAVSPSQSRLNVSKADELSKLAKLRADGILTEDEFQAAKGKLLAS